MICSNCGEENPAKFRLCGFCGTPLAATVAAPEVRKTVTVVFSDLQGSTNLGEALDSESLREVLSRYFDEMRAVLEHHGGAVEKYIGDAVMAVFGLPTLHEDDALRAVRAAADMQRALATLNDELERRWGVRLTNRTGVNTGEVVAGDPTTGQRLVTGDTVNVAARLEQAAPPLEVLLGESTYRLVRDAVDVEPVEPLALKGKSEPVPAYRLLSATGIEGVARRHDRGLVGRETELAALVDEFGRAAAESSCRLVTILGEAGLGKSRLTEELAQSVADQALVLRGRCLPYGRGITFWPLVEIVRQAASIGDDDSPEAARKKVAALAGDEEVTERVAAAVGLSVAQFPVADIFWGTRRLFEHLARTRPLVIVFEDIHWAEETLLELVEHVNGALAGARVLIVCAARPDLDELRPAWRSAGTPVATRIELEPLSELESDRVVANLLGDAGIETAIRRRIVRAAEGNPLFVEQLLSMLIDDGHLRREGDAWVSAGDLSDLAIPPTIHALLAARLDLLTREERAIVERAAVIGLVFPQAAVEALVPSELHDGVADGLAALTRRQLIRPDPSQLGAEPSFRFQHILVRDAAYNGILKRARATLHEGFVDWAEEVNRDRDRAMEYEEILGYHLEQAFRNLSELGPLDEHGTGIGVRGAEKLAAAGRRAFGRNDMAAAANLLRRAVQLLPERDSARLRLLPDLAEALTESGELPWAEIFLDEAIAGASEAGDERLRAEATLVKLHVSRYADKLDRWTATMHEEGMRAIGIFEELGDHAGLARAWRLIMNAQGVAYQFGAAAEAAQRAAEEARLAGDIRQETRAASGYAMAALYGPTPVAEAIARCEEVLAQSPGDKRLEGLTLCLLAPLRAMQGDFDEARDLYARGRQILEEIGGTLIAASTTFNASDVETLAGDLAAAEDVLRRDYELLDRLGEKYLRPTVAAYLGQVLSKQGRYDEAERFVDVAADVAAADDVVSQALWRSVRANVLAHGERFDEAVALAREAVGLLRETDGLSGQADALLALAEVLGRAGDRGAAERVVREALALYERKGNAVAASAARAVLTDAPAPSRSS